MKKKTEKEEKEKKTYKQYKKALAVTIGLIYLKHAII